MLLYRSHWHFANENNPERARRLLRFADNTNNNEEANKAQQAHQEGGPNANNAGELDELTKKYRKLIARLRPKIAEATIQSPFALDQALDLLKDHQFKDLKGIQEFKRRARAFRAEEQKDEDEIDSEKLATMREELTQDAEVLLDHPRFAEAISQAFDERIKYFQELKRTIGNAALPIVAEFERKLSDEKKAHLEEAELKHQDPNNKSFKTEMLSNVDAWSEQEVDQAVQSLQIDASQVLKKDWSGMSPEQRKAAQACIENTVVSAQDAVNGVPTKAFKLRLVYEKLEAARKLAIIDQKDLGRDPKTISSIEEMEAALIKQRNLARKHLARLLELRAAELHSSLEKLRQKVFQNDSDTDLTPLAASYGVSVIAASHRFRQIKSTIQRALRFSESDNGIDDSTNLPSLQDDRFTQQASTLLDQMDDLAFLNLSNTEEALKEFVGIDVQFVATEAENWVLQNTDLVTTALTRLQHSPQVRSTAEKIFNRHPGKGEKHLSGTQLIEVLQDIQGHAMRVASGQTTQDERDYLWENFSPAQRMRFDALLEAIVSPATLDLIERDFKLINKDTTENTAESRQSLLQELSDAHATLSKNQALKHDTCKLLNVPAQLEQYKNTISAKIAIAASIEKTDPDMARNLIRECNVQIQKFDQTNSELAQIETGTTPPIERFNDPELPPPAQYRHNEPVRIIINTALIPEQARAWNISEAAAEKRMIEHEQGHAIVACLSYRIGLLPGLLHAVRGQLNSCDPQDPSGKKGWKLLHDVAEYWDLGEKRRAEYVAFETKRLLRDGIEDGGDISAIASETAEARLQQDLLDELTNRYASWVQSGRATAGISSKELQLFQLLEHDGSTPQKIRINVPEIRFDAIERPDEGLHMSRAIPDPDDEEEDPDTKKSGVKMIAQDITEKRNKFLLLKAFIKTHKDVEGIEEFENTINQWEKDFEENIVQEYEKNDDDRDEKRIIDELAKLGKKFVDADKEIAAVNKQELEHDLGERKRPQGVRSFFQSFQLVSIYDIVATFKSAKEDLTRMWKRRGERVQSAFGKSLTGWIPDNEIWGLSYLGQMKHEFERRGQASELTEVKQWKDALENMDAWELQDILGISRNRDQLRAAVELLIEKGRLDFNDTKFWETMSIMSGLHMPIGACENSDILRDKYMQKMVSIIWADKDKFFEWKQKNDSGTESGKKAFTGIADQLSNVDGGLSGALERQLKLWTEARVSGDKIPDEVNPHLYEELLDYAMRNGKMTMEGKLFYLVQGVRSELLSIDRLRSLAGEKGGVLMRFPMLDYFYQHHNTLPEIEALGKRLEEDKDSEKGSYAPGPKTTLWLHLELLRDEEARRRMAKATSRTAAENLDHEDIPALMAQGDYKFVDRITNIVSGSREKMSPEGAKNAYTGFGTKFKVLSRLAELDKFTNGDVEESLKSIIAYVHYDNIVTRNGLDAQQSRNEITWEEMEQQAPSTAPGLVTSHYRNANTNFVYNFVKAFEGQIQWGGLKIPSTGKDMTVDEFVRSVDNKNSRTNKQDQEAVYNATKIFSKEIHRIFTTDPTAKQKLKDLLKLNKEHFKEEIYNDSLKKEVVEEYLSDRRAHGIGI